MSVFLFFSAMMVDWLAKTHTIQQLAFLIDQDSKSCYCNTGWL